jgi:UDPglucose 6-dehydrogenase
MLREAEAINKHRVDLFIEKLRQALWVIKDKRVGILGLAFKANTDDIRFAPSLGVIERLLAEGAHLRAYDQEAMDKTSALFPQVEFCREPHQVARDADAVLILTEWPEFRQLDWKRVYAAMSRPLIVDGRNLLDRATMTELGFEYHSFGRPLEKPQPQPIPSVMLGASSSAVEQPRLAT